MKIEEILKNKRTLSFEFFPPKKEEDFKSFIKAVKELKKYNPDFVSITDSQIFAKTKHIALAIFLKEKFNLNILIHLTCINNTTKEIEYLINSITENNIQNILALRGDRRNFIKTANDFKYATDLILKIPEEKFSIGVACYPEGYPDSNIENDLFYLKKKKELGADFAITQVFFDNASFFRFRDRVKREVGLPIICGIMPVISLKMVEGIIKKIGKIKIPDDFLKVINSKLSNKDFLNYSRDFSIRQIEELLRNGIDGIHFFTLNSSILVKEIIEGIKI